MLRVVIIANESEQVKQLSSALIQRGFDCLVAPYSDKAIKQLAEQSPDIVLLNIDESITSSEVQELSRRITEERHVPVIALVSGEKVSNLDHSISIDDFAVKPWEASEVTARIKRVLRQTNSLGSKELIKCGDLVIDLAKCEVSLGGKPIILTFKEFQLLKFLASNPGKVFTRQALLDKVWGWDYYGGDRTVDVHIRRLRSKIENSTHNFIETVRNIGYRLRENS